MDWLEINGARWKANLRQAWMTGNYHDFGADQLAKSLQQLLHNNQLSNTINNMKTLLTKLNACKEAIDWVGNKTIEQAWNECQRGDWLLWLAAKLDIDRKILVYAACQCARTALQYVPTGEKRPLIAIETAERWCRGEATLDEVKIAARAAAASANDGAAYAAASYAAAARTNALKECVEIIRNNIPYSVIMSKLT